MGQDHAYNRYIPSVGTQRIHISLYFSHNNRRHCPVWRKQNVKYHAKCIQTTVKLPASVKVWEAISNRGLSLQRNVNGNMNVQNTRVILFMILK